MYANVKTSSIPAKKADTVAKRLRTDVSITNAKNLKSELA